MGTRTITYRTAGREVNSTVVYLDPHHGQHTGCRDCCIYNHPSNRKG